MLKGWKTLLFACAVALAGVFQAFDWATVIPQDKAWSGVVMLAIGAMIAALRFVTKTPIGRSDNTVEFTPTGRKLVIGFLVIGGSLVFFAIGEARAVDLQKPLPPVPQVASVPVCSIAFCTGFYLGGGLDGNGTSADILGSGLSGSVFGAGAIPSANAGYQFWNGSILLGGEAGVGYAIPMRSSVNGVDANPMQSGIIAYQEFQVGGQLSGLLGQGSQPSQSVTVPTALAPYLIAPYAAVGVAEGKGTAGMDVGAGLKFAFSPNLMLDLGYRHLSLQAVTGPVETKSENIIRLRLNYVFKGL